MKKTLVFAIITLLIGVSVFSSVSSRYISISDIGKLNTNLLKKTHENQLIKIINKMKKKLDEVNTQREYNLIFKETLIEFDKLGLLGGKSVNEVYNFITNNGNAPYSIHGESSDTYIIENIGIYLYNHGFEFLYKLFLVKIKFRFHLNSWISYGWAYGIYDDIYEWHPAEGYLNVTSAEGDEYCYNGTFYGHIKSLINTGVHNFPVPFYYEWDFVGVIGFRGIAIGNYYFGTATEVNVSKNKPHI